MIKGLKFKLLCGCVLHLNLKLSLELEAAPCCYKGGDQWRTNSGSYSIRSRWSNAVSTTTFLLANRCAASFRCNGMAGSTSCACFPASFPAQWSHIASYGRTLRPDLPAATRLNPHFGLQFPGSRGVRWIINASIAGTGEACNGSANGVHSRESEVVPVGRHWKETSVSWVAQPATPGPLREATDYCDVPLNYYQVRVFKQSLGSSITADSCGPPSPCQSECCQSLYVFPHISSC